RDAFPVPTPRRRFALRRTEGLADDTRGAARRREAEVRLDIWTRDYYAILPHHHRRYRLAPAANALRLDHLAVRQLFRVVIRPRPLHLEGELLTGVVLRSLPVVEGDYDSPARN